MTSFNFGAMIDKAKAEGAISDPPPDGPYVLRVKNANHGTTTKKDPKFGIQWEVCDGGPQNGKTFWDNIMLIESKPQNVAISLRTLATLGVTEEFLRSTGDPDSVVAQILRAPAIRADVTFKAKDGFVNCQMRKMQAVDGSAGPAPVVPAAQPAPAPAPAVTFLPQPAPFVPPSAAPVVPGDPTAYEQPAAEPVPSEVRTY